MSNQQIGSLPHQMMAEDSPDYDTLELMDDILKKDFLIVDTGNIIETPEAIIDPMSTLTYYEEETRPMSSVPCHIPQENTYQYPRGPPLQTVDPGRFNFTAKVANNSNKKYLYSEGLNKLYADVNCDFAVNFTWSPVAGPVYVRACMVYADKEHAERRVECCMQHRHAPDVPDNIRLNILRSSREFGTQGVYYHGSPACPDSWYSVLVHFAADARTRSHAYRFACKNSCSSGINRRATAVVFTLEDQEFNVHGRQVIGVRVCSCPPRDCRKDEENAGIQRAKKRLAKQPVVAKGKKVKVETLTSAQNDEGIFTLPPLQVVGANVMAAGLDVMVKMMEHGKSLRKDDAQYVHSCNLSIDSIKATLEQYQRDSP